jgi:hypothetical protein
MRARVARRPMLKLATLELLKDDLLSAWTRHRDQIRGPGYDSFKPRRDLRPTALSWLVDQSGCGVPLRNQDRTADRHLGIRDRGSRGGELGAAGGPYYETLVYTDHEAGAVMEGSFDLLWRLNSKNLIAHSFDDDRNIASGDRAYLNGWRIGIDIERPERETRLLAYRTGHGSLHTGRREQPLRRTPVATAA